jgi:hypothetical protein
MAPSNSGYCVTNATRSGSVFLMRPDFLDDGAGAGQNQALGAFFLCSNEGISFGVARPTRPSRASVAPAVALTARSKSNGEWTPNYFGTFALLL